MKRLILVLLTGAAFAASSPAYAAVKTIVLVHGRVRRWFRMEAGGGHSPESRLLGTSCPGA
jgi:hypothetical protein